jgi:hypothetical protein
MRFRPLRRHAPEGDVVPAEEEARDAAPPAGEEGVERMTAVEWARKHQVNSVMAERAAMYAGKRDAPLTEAEFLEMLRRDDV